MVLNEVNFKGFFFFAFFEQPQRYIELPYDWISNFVFPELKISVLFKKKYPVNMTEGAPLCFTQFVLHAWDGASWGSYSLPSFCKLETLQIFS